MQQRIIKRTIRRMSPVAFAWAVMAAPASAAGQASDSIRVDQADVNRFTNADSIAGGGYAEDFESGYEYTTPCDPPPGWSCPPAGMQIINHPDLCFGDYSALDAATDTGTSGGDLMTPAFALQTAALHTDIIITDASSLWQWNSISVAPGNTANFFNVRLNFQTNGAITALQIDTNVQPNCAAGTISSFHLTAGQWTPNVKMRIGIELQPGGGAGSLKIFKDGELIFTGTDISQTCAPANPVGMSRLRNYSQNVGATSKMVIDNISGNSIVDPCSCELASCAADVAPNNGDGMVNIGDLLTVIANWGRTQDPPSEGLRPQGDCEPPPHGNCAVNIADLLAVIAAWGPCR